MISASNRDRFLGMDYYITDNPGCGGIIKSCADDFQVTEVFEELGYEGGRYLVLDVEKTNWDTHHLIREMARKLRISQKRFGWAGTKDKKAVTTQRISIMNLDESALSRINLPDLKIRVLGKTNRAVGLGDLLGNRFRIAIRDMSCPDPAVRLAAITSEIEEYGGVPNYFGIQRFGDQRPVTHKVGEALARGKAQEAAFIFLALAFPGELESTRAARERLWETRDIPAALKEFPEYLRYELAMLNYLVEHPGDYAHSFDVLSVNLKRLFVHAYQSYLFNRILSRRMSVGMPLQRAVVGDVVCFAKEGLPDMDRVQKVTMENLEAIDRLAKRGRAFLTLPLIGFETAIDEGAEGEIEQSILREEGISPENFRVPENPDLGSRGTRRAALCHVKPQIRVEENQAELQFTLPKGSYATVVLREYMKSADDIMSQTK
ncbi:MAG: tRNA pseudouridine(13) synthase TruD [Methanothrix sp.]|nr:tRNA pseudouridine(13) synthase TruD [Methanothrix sp.]MDD4446875.1 tRNA pseudouridine(13) synthase TruD [Methanothrix sp.]